MNRMKTYLLWAFLLLYSATAVAAEGKSDETRSDLWLKAKIVTAFALNEHLNPFKLDVEVEDGVARLGGTVDSAVERDLAVEIAKGTEGIRDVKQDIRIEPGANAGERRESGFFRMVEDATITASVKSRLLWNRNTDGLGIHVTTEQGVVTLEGEVASGAQKDLAVQMARNTKGVHRVKSDLKVVPESGKAKGEGTLDKMVSEASDAWITTKVESALLISKETEGADIDVSTTDQVVTLEGTVVNNEQKGKILEMVENMADVKEVRSKLSLDKG